MVGAAAVVSVFRAMLIAAATKAPDDPAEAAKLVWDAYYGNHQKNEAFRKLKVADIFMGGGTTVVEGARLGMQMYGNDLNPVAWFVVKNELAQVDPAEVQKLLDQIEAEVKPQIMPFYACDCPRGDKGKWTHSPTAGDGRRLRSAGAQARGAKGVQVRRAGNHLHVLGEARPLPGHRMRPPHADHVLAGGRGEGALGQEPGRTECPRCARRFDIEESEARMAPTSCSYCSPDEAAVRGR